MKKLTMIVHSSLQQALADCLRSLHLNTFVFTHVEEHSAQLQRDTFLSERDKVVGYVPQVRVDVILDSDKTKQVLDDIRSMKCSFKGRGNYWVSDVDEAGDL